MIKKIVIFLSVIFLHACSNEQNIIKNLEYKNFKNNIASNNLNEKIKNSKFDFCILILCSNYTAYDIDNFIFETLEKVNKNQNQNNAITNINFTRKNYEFYIFNYRTMNINADVINLKNT